MALFDTYIRLDDIHVRIWVTEYSQKRYNKALIKHFGVSGIRDKYTTFRSTLQNRISTVLKPRK